MDDRQAFGRWLKRLRAERDMTQAAVAAEAGCALQTVRAFEIGRRRPSRDLAERLAAVLKVPLDERSAFIWAAIGDEGAQVASVAQEAGQQAAAAALTSSLIMTKLYRPHVPAAVVERPRLYEKLSAGVAGPLTLVAAPAGFGKTTLVAQQLAARSDISAWLSLDADDNDPATFVRYL
jgi:transcriptional regulator with XRE-family HTH domain